MEKTSIDTDIQMKRKKKFRNCISEGNNYLVSSNAENMEATLKLNFDYCNEKRNVQNEKKQIKHSDENNSLPLSECAKNAETNELNLCDDHNGEKVSTSKENKRKKKLIKCAVLSSESDNFPITVCTEKNKIKDSPISVKKILSDSNIYKQKQKKKKWKYIDVNDESKNFITSSCTKNYFNEEFNVSDRSDSVIVAIGNNMKNHINRKMKLGEGLNLNDKTVILGYTENNDVQPNTIDACSVKICTVSNTQEEEKKIIKCIDLSKDFDIPCLEKHLNNNVNISNSFSNNTLCDFEVCTKKISNENKKVDREDDKNGLDSLVIETDFSWDLKEDPVDFSIPILHAHESLTSLRKEQVCDLISRGVEIKSTKCTNHEKDILLQNWNDIVNRYGINDPALLFGIGQIQHQIIKKFVKAKHIYVRLARNLEDRPLKWVYRKAQKLLNPSKKYANEILLKEDPVDFPIPILHAHESLTSLRKEQVCDLKSRGVEIKSRKWTNNEEYILLQNWNYIVNRYGISDPALLLGIGQMQHQIIKKFIEVKHIYVRLARNLEDRPLECVYRKAQRLLNSSKKYVNEILNMGNEKVNGNASETDHSWELLSEREEDPVNFPIPILHAKESVRTIPKEKLSNLISRGVRIRKGKWSKNEDSIILQNWKDIVDKYGVNDPTLLLGIGKGRCKAIFEFAKAKHIYVRLAHNLQDRTLRSVYSRAKRLLHPARSRGRILDNEVSQIKDLHKVLGNSWESIGKIVGRSGESCLQAFRWHNKLFRNGFWSSEEDQRLIKAIKKAKKRQRNQLKRREMLDRPVTESISSLNVSDETRNREIISKKSWEKISTFVATRNVLQCQQRWHHYLCWNPEERCMWTFEDSEKLVDLLKKDLVEDETRIDWKLISSFFVSFPSIPLIRKRWRYLKSRVPETEGISHKKIVDYLYFIYIPNIKSNV